MSCIWVPLYVAPTWLPWNQSIVIVLLYNACIWVVIWHHVCTEQYNFWRLITCATFVSTYILWYLFFQCDKIYCRCRWQGATRQSFMLGCTASCVACRHSQWGTKGFNSLFIACVGSLHALCTNKEFQLSLQTTNLAKKSKKKKAHTHAPTHTLAHKHP
jgi:hypothetical protein